jgi:hypothetical protein
VVFQEDGERIKSGEAPENWAYLRKVGMTVARTDTAWKDCVRNRVNHMAWSDEYFERLLFHSSFISKTPPQAVSS